MKKNPSGRRKVQRTVSSNTGTYTADEQSSLEGRIVGLALKGELRAASHRARRRHRALGIPVTHKKGSKVVKVYPGGKVEILAEISAPKYALPDGVIVINES